MASSSNFSNTLESSGKFWKLDMASCQLVSRYISRSRYYYRVLPGGIQDNLRVISGISSDL
eukprot:1178366-Amorphochlora_amoeboformis.AAC.1